MPRPISALFVGADRGPWHVERIAAVRGEPLPSVAALAVREHARLDDAPSGAAWVLRGTTGHLRYAHRDEHAALAPVTPPLGRAEASLAAMIAIRKSDAWWDLAQDERRAVLEAQSRHIATGLRYLPAIARRLYHSRELGEPFDFVTWFEYAPAHAEAFEELVAALRATPEWAFVTREFDVRLRRT